MANPEHVARLRRGIKEWNAWRSPYGVLPDLRGAELGDADLRCANLREADLQGAFLFGANLSGADLIGADLTGAILAEAELTSAYLVQANLREANLSEADLSEANLSGAILSDTNLNEAILTGADLTGANLSGADLIGADLSGADLSGADLVGAKLIGAKLVGAKLVGADLRSASLVLTNVDQACFDGCRVYGLSAWDLRGVPRSQKDLVITPTSRSPITADNLKVAQFIYLLLYNPDIRDVINTVTSKVVLILGRFTDERKRVLEGMRADLRHRGFVPVLFDFEPSASRDLTETISTLAHMSRFIIADITEPQSIPHELQLIVPHLPSVPIQPILLGTEHTYGMFEHFEGYPWVLPITRYDDVDDLLGNIKTRVIDPAERKRNQLLKRREGRR